MTQEEKAKRYDEALGKARRYYDEYKTRDNILYVEDMEDMFPELKESDDDDEIRKDILNYIKHNYDGQHISISRYDSWIAWLERQCKPQIRTGLEWVNTIDDACNKRYSEEYAHGEYCHEQSFKWGFQEGVDWLEKQAEHANFRNKIQIGDKVTRNEDGVLVNLSKLKRVAKPAEEQGEQKQELLTKEKALKNSPFVEQKSAEWSEDDQSNFCELRSFIVETYRAEDASKLITWLESLKDRVQPQPKQEWSEEDEQTFIKSVEALEDFGKFELADWLKEHKNQFLKPQNTWKPSDEQMVALEHFIVYHNGSTNYAKDLEELRLQLKKMREE